MTDVIEGAFWSEVLVIIGHWDFFDLREGFEHVKANKFIYIILHAPVIFRNASLT